MIRTLTLSALLIFVSNLYATDLQTAEAIARDQRVLQGDAKNKEALADIVDQLDGAGRWKEALPYLSTLNEVEPNDAARAPVGDVLQLV